MTHDDLCRRAVRWLSGTRRCNPVYWRNASCAEIPDAIGWSSSCGWYGSTVIECKTSVSDFYADKRKRFQWHGQDGWKMRHSRMSSKRAQEAGYKRIEVPIMGDFRFYFCLPAVLLPELVEEHAPDHGLIYLDGRSVRIIRHAPRRTLVDKNSEIRYLRFAIINAKESAAVEQRRGSA